MSSLIDRAVRSLRAGGVIVYPTDTLFGLGARACDRRAVQHLVRIKDRPTGMPISIGVSSVEEIEPLAALNPVHRRFLRRELTGPFTILLPASAWSRKNLAPAVVDPAGTLGLRVPDHPVARELARRVGPITATSANRHGDSPARTVEQARRIFGTDVKVYVNEGPRPIGRPSKLVDMRGKIPRVVVR